MHTLNEDAVEYAANNLFTTELGYAEIIWGPDIAPEGARAQEREFSEVVLSNLSEEKRYINLISNNHGSRKRGN